MLLKQEVSITYLGVPLLVYGTYYARTGYSSNPATAINPPEPSSFEIDSVTFYGSKLDAGDFVDNVSNYYRYFESAIFPRHQPYTKIDSWSEIAELACKECE